jgi:hypothetical protein
VVADSSQHHLLGMPYRDMRTSPAAPLPPPPLWETLWLWGFVAFAPWLVPWLVVRDARAHLRLASLPAPLDAEGRAELLGRLEREAPQRVTRFVTIVHTIASGDEEVWNVVVVRFADGLEHVVASFVGAPAIDHGGRVIATVRRHRDVRTLIDEEICLGLPGLAVVLSLPPMLVWAFVLTLGIGPPWSLLALAPLPLALALFAMSRRAAAHVLDAH